MDFTSRGRAWLDNIGEKLENLCFEVDARSQVSFVGLPYIEQINFVESQFQIASANLKQFCVGVIQEILPGSLSAVEEETSNLFSEQNREQHPASELSNISVQEDSKDELSCSNSSSLKLAVEATEGVHADPSLQPTADKAMKMSIEDWENILGFTGKSSAQVAFTEETLKMTLSCESSKEVEVPAKSSTIPPPVECLEFDPSMQEVKTIDFKDHGANTSNVPSLTCSIYSTESQESVLDFDEINSNAAVPAVSNGASVVHLQDEPVIGSVTEVKFDGNCVLVDKDDFSSGSECHGAHISHKKNMTMLKVKLGKQRNKDAAKCEDLIVELEESNAEGNTISSPTDKLELSQEGFYESDWEII